MHEGEGGWGLEDIQRAKHWMRQRCSRSAGCSGHVNTHGVAFYLSSLWYAVEYYVLQKLYKTVTLLF